MILDCVTKNTSQTQKLAERLAKKIISSKPGRKGALILSLTGDLGGGKTTFLQGFARGLGIKEKITSPTFVIIKRFRLSGYKFQNFYHIDCYRILKTKEILNLGFKKIISNPRNIVAIEWAEKVKGLLKKKQIKIKFDFLDKNSRKIKIKK